MSELITTQSTDGTTIALWREGEGPALLVLHGAAADHTAWDQVTPLLTDVFTVYAMDRRGRGRSGDAPGWTLEREVEDVLAALAAIPGPVFLYGHSFGGICALEAALRHPSDLAALILYEGGIKAPAAAVPAEFIQALDSLVLDGRREEALTFFLKHGPRLDDDELQRYRASSGWAGRVAAVHTIARELRASRAETRESPYPEGLPDLQVPVVGLVGERTFSQLREMFMAMLDHVPDARVHELPGQTHTAHETAPDLLARSLRDALLPLASGQVA